MLRTIALLVFIFCMNSANAQNCPDFYRFVDFGIKANDGLFYRGGTVFRAEGFEGQALLLSRETKCRDVRDISKDGHGNPIPVVTSINYDPGKTGIDLNELRLSRVDDTKIAAEKNADLHQQSLEYPDIVSTRGPNFLCASEKQQALSCQLVSPYPGYIPLVVYCDFERCKMPVLAVSETLQVSASWDIGAKLSNSPEMLGTEISNKAQQIHDFLKPLSAAL